MIKSSLADQIYDIIRERIINLNLDFGERIDVQKLAEEFGISQTPILFALNRLSDTGLVVRQARTGFYVLELTEKDLEEIYDLREMFEVHALKTAIKNVSRSELENLKQRMKSVPQIADDQRRKELFHETDRTLHLMIIEGCGNKKAKELFLYVYGIVRISIFMGVEWEISLKDHVALVDAMLERDLDRARSVLEKHIHESKYYSITQLRKKKQAAS
jgi:DNA-binding GntR family transcriptional regulator